MNPQSPQQQPAGQSQGSQQAPLSPPQPASVSLWCHSCGAENRPNASFCTNCGVRLTPAPQSQLPQAQSQGRGHVPSRSQLSHPKNSRKLSTGERVALIGAISTIVVAIITYILAPVLINAFTHNPTSTPTASPTTTSISSGTTSNVYPPVGWKLVYSDPLKSNSSGYWHVSAHGLAGNDGICTFANDVYQVNTIKGYWHRCYNDFYDLTNFAIEVQMTIVNGDQGGIAFRLDDQTGNYYFFWISAAGTYGLEIWDNDTLSQTLSSASSAAIHTGFNQPNTVAVVAQGNTFKLYVNNQSIDTVTDKGSSYGHGIIALEVSSVSNPTEVLFSNVKMWTPSS